MTEQAVLLKAVSGEIDGFRAADSLGWSPRTQRRPMALHTDRAGWAFRTRTATGPVDNRLHQRAIATGPEAAGPPAASGPVFSSAVPPPERSLISPTGQGSRRRERRARGTTYKTSKQVELTLTSTEEPVVFRYHSRHVVLMIWWSATDSSPPPT